MVLLKEALVTPRGIYLRRPLRLMFAPFAKDLCALQNVQGWVVNPNMLSDAQVARNRALIDAARAAAGTFGTTTNPKTGRPMPAIAAKVAEIITGKLSPEEKIARRREFSRRYREKKRAAKAASPQYAAYLARLGTVAPPVTPAGKWRAPP